MEMGRIRTVKLGETSTRLLHCHPPHLDIFSWTLNENFSDIQEVTQFCTTDFCSYPVRLLAESCVYATFQVRSVNQLDRREHCLLLQNSKQIKLIQLYFKKIIPCFVYIWQNWQHYTDYWLEDHLFCISLFLGWWVGFIHFSPSEFPLEKVLA